jgi:hypothetical protein
LIVASPGAVISFSVIPVFVIPFKKNPYMPSKY